MKDDLRTTTVEELRHLLHEITLSEDESEQYQEPEHLVGEDDKVWMGHTTQMDVVPRDEIFTQLRFALRQDADVETSPEVPDTPVRTESNTAVIATAGQTAAGADPTHSLEGDTDYATSAAEADNQKGIQASHSMASADLYPTPDNSPSRLGDLMAACFHGDPNPEDKRTEEADIEVLKTAFQAGQLATPLYTRKGRLIDKAQLQRLLQKPRNRDRLGHQEPYKIHRNDLPPPPKWHNDLATHLLEEEFKEAERCHLESNIYMKSWIEVNKGQALRNNILDCMWVYVYKCDKHGKLLKCKARLVVRGDQQPRTSHEDTYASTLAGKSFRTLMAIAARFDLELTQFDAVNAFVNTKIDQDVFMRMPPGYRKAGKLLKLQRALYGLRASPLLWQKELTNTLQEQGFQPIPHEPCAMMKSGIIIFFYVDDIVLAYRSNQKHQA